MTEPSAPQLRWFRVGLGAVFGGWAIVWLIDTPTELPGIAPALLAAGRLTGIGLGILTLVQLLLMARVTPVERRLGADLLARLHASIGRYIFGLLALHVPAVLIGYAGATHNAVLAEAGIFLRDYPYVWAAGCAGILLVLLGLLAWRRVRSRLPYEVWYLSHLTAYVAIALAFGHQIAVGSDFVHDRGHRVVWVAMYLVVATVVLYYRVLVPLRLNLRARARISAVRPESGGVVTLQVAVAAIPLVAPGQFFRVRVLGRGLWWQSHPYSLSALPTVGQLQFTLRPEGQFGRALRSVRPGTRVVLAGPFGSLTPQLPDAAKVLLIAGGIGITPLRTIFEAVAPQGTDVVLIYRASSNAELLFRPELDALALTHDVRVEYVVGPRGEVGDRLGDAGLRSMVPDLAERHVYLCAPESLVVSLRSTLRTAGVPQSQVHFESFALPKAPTSPPRQLSAAAFALVATVVVLGLRSQWFVGSGTRTILVANSVGALPTAPIVKSDGIIRGPVERTLYADVQVGIKVNGHKLVDVIALQLPDLDARSRQISAMSVPILRAQALRSNGLNVDVVTGATYTSEAYANSLAGAVAQIPR